MKFSYALTKFLELPLFVRFIRTNQNTNLKFNFIFWKVSIIIAENV